MARPTPSILADRRAGWRAARLDRVTAAAGSLRLATLPGPSRPIAAAAGDFGGLVLPQSVTVAADGTIYLLDGRERRVKRYDPCRERFEPLPCRLAARGGTALGGPPLGGPLGEGVALAVAPWGDLAVVDAARRHVSLVIPPDFVGRGLWGPFAWSAGRLVPVHPKAALDPATLLPTGELEWPAGAWLPAGIAFTAQGTALVSDRVHGRIHEFGRRGGHRRSFAGIDPDGMPLDQPTALALDRDGRLYVVEAGSNTVAVLDPDGAFLERIAAAAPVSDRFAPPALSVDAEGTIWLGDRVAGLTSRLCRGPDGRCLPPEPVPLVPANCPVLAFDPAGNAILGDPVGRCLRIAETQRFEALGVYWSEPFDSGLPGCVFDRVILDLNLPAGSRLVVETMTSPVSLDFAEVLAIADDQWTATPVTVLDGPHWDCAVRSRPGRWLWLRLTLISEGPATPEIDAIEVSYPRLTSRRYLPAVFSEEPASADFLDRFLEIFDHARADRLGPSQHFAAYLDPWATPAAAVGEPGGDFLDWLAGWIGLSLDRNWPVRRRRALVAAAPGLFRWRGTVRALKRFVALAIEREPAVLEHYRLRRWLWLDGGRLDDSGGLWGPEIVRRLQLDGYSEIGRFQLVDGGDPTTDPFGVFAHRCTLFIPVGDSFTDADQADLEAVIAFAAPAHVEVETRLIRPGFAIDCDTVLGINTVIGRTAAPARIDQARLGTEIRLAADNPGFRLKQGLRLGIDTAFD